MDKILENSTSLKFKHISENTSKLTNALLKNQNFLKWITYLEPDPLKCQDVNPLDVLGENFILTKFDERALSSSGIKVFLTPLQGIQKKNTITSIDVYEINIILPNKYWYIYETMELRPFEIAREIAVTLDKQRIAGLGKVVMLSNYNTFRVGKGFAGLVLYVHVENASFESINGER